MQISYRNFFFEVFLSLFIIFFIYLFFCDYFLIDYESLFNYFSFIISSSNSNPPNLSDINFGVTKTIVFLQKKFPELNFYVIQKILTLGIVTIAFLSFFINFRLLKFNKFHFFIFSFFLIDLFVLIHTNKITTILLLISAVQFIVKKTNFYSVFLFFLLIITSILIRVDLTFILISLSFFFSILYFNKINFKLNLLAFILSAFGLFIFINKVTKNTDDLKNFHTVERAIQDRMDFIVDKPSEDKTLNRKELILYGMGMFLLDKEVQENISYKSLVKHTSLKDYIFSNPDFLNIYFSKLYDLWEETKNRYLINFFLSILSILFIGYFHWIFKIQRWKFVLSLLAYIGLPLAINTIAIIETSFFTVYLLLPIFVAYFLFLKHYSNSKRLFILHFFLFLISLLNFYFFLLPEINNYKHQEETKVRIMKSFRKDNENGCKPIVTYVDYHYFLPSNIKFNYTDIEFIFLDAGAYNNLDHFKKTHLANFGDNYTSFLSRFEQGVNKNEYLYSSKSTLEFMTLYLKRVHNTDIKYECFEKYGDIDFYKYKVSIIKKPKD